MVALNSLTRKVRRREDLHFMPFEIELRRNLQQQIESERRKQELAKAVRHGSAELIDRLFDAGFTADTIGALTMAPIALIAWGSGEVTDAERTTAMAAVEDSELAGNPAAIAKFQSWLDSRPDPQLFLLWSDFTKSRFANPWIAIQKTRHDRVIRFASEVAEASGGLLGYGSICAGEQTILNQMRDVLAVSQNGSQ